MNLKESMLNIAKDQIHAISELKLAVVKAAHSEVLQSVKQVLEEIDAKLILIDDKAALEEQLKTYAIPAEKYEIIDIAEAFEASQKAVELVKQGEVNAIMKGHLSTGKLLKAVVDKEKGIRKSDLLSHVAVLYIPKLNRLVGVTDGGMVLQPSKAEMQVIVEHAVSVFHKLGIKQPKVSLLSAAETVIPKLPASVFAQELTETTADAIIEGPLSIDLSLDSAIAEDKHYDGAIQGDADIIAVPDIVSGNSLSKSLIMFGQAQMAGIILGAEVPIILTSRSSSADEKFSSVLLSQLLIS
ncbi:phosphate acyltransferase [Staphylococcus lutrae]|uniref:Phosphate acetyl/butyryl transferase n=1 Tax=Staphylococcus lutrae TaxID=155085 RepID=A0AAC9WMF2_9STAP|nr:phosphate acyltransferase [Staphylococcus lutrae]ARJ50837.1 phosphate acetyl/butyryl transferase [Staphylococcus lutrae]PNZ36807.1 phosphate acetyl/butyryl transferase [Staphylococcus lutrae]